MANKILTYFHTTTSLTCTIIAQTSSCRISTVLCCLRPILPAQIRKVWTPAFLPMKRVSTVVQEPVSTMGLAGRQHPRPNQPTTLFLSAKPGSSQSAESSLLCNTLLPSSSVETMIFKVPTSTNWSISLLTSMRPSTLLSVKAYCAGSRCVSVSRWSQMPLLRRTISST